MAAIPFFSRKAPWFQGVGAATTRWMESTLEMARWENMRRAGRRWGWWGVGMGALTGFILFAPASWLAQLLVNLSGKHLLLADSHGTIWQGDAVAVLTGGPGSRDARALPGRLYWSMRPQTFGLRLTLKQDCCMPTPVAILVKPGLSGVRIEARLQPTDNTSVKALQDSGELGHWPAAWLGGLGTPWNTLQLGGVMRLSARGLAFDIVKGRLRMEGQADLIMDNMSSRITTLDRLGSYKLDLVGDAEGKIQLSLFTLDGALQMNGQGSISPGRVRFMGEARANEAERGALENLLNIIGRRAGDRSVISIG